MSLDICKTERTTPYPDGIYITHGKNNHVRPLQWRSNSHLVIVTPKKTGRKYRGKVGIHEQGFGKNHPGHIIMVADYHQAFQIFPYYSGKRETSWPNRQIFEYPVDELIKFIDTLKQEFSANTYVSVATANNLTKMHWYFNGWVYSKY